VAEIAEEMPLPKNGKKVPKMGTKKEEKDGGRRRTAD